MSGLWTPSGEHHPEPQPPPGPAGGEAGAPGAREPSAEELAALRAAHERIAATPVVDLIANHAIGLWQLALVHLGVATPPDEHGRVPRPDLPAAALAIDALGALVDGLGARLGPHEQALQEARSQAQVLYAQVAEALGQAGGATGGEAGTPGT